MCLGSVKVGLLGWPYHSLSMGISKYWRGGSPIAIEELPQHLSWWVNFHIHFMFPRPPCKWPLVFFFFVIIIPPLFGNMSYLAPFSLWAIILQHLFLIFVFFLVGKHGQCFLSNQIFNCIIQLNIFVCVIVVALVKEAIQVLVHSKMFSDML